MKKAYILLSALLCVTLLFSGCGAADADAENMREIPDSFEYKSEVDFDYALESGAVTESTTADSFVGAESDKANTSSSLQLGNPDPTRKLVYTVNYTLESKTFDAAVAALLELTESLGGYTEGSDTQGGSGSERNARYVLRIPSENLQQFIASVGTVGSIRSESMSTQDVTLEYVDVESRLTSLRAQEARLIELLGKANTLEEILKIEDSLANVRYQIESYTTRLNTLAALVSYSTVNVRLLEVIEYTPVVKPPLTFGEKLGREFTNSIERVWDGLQDFAIWFLGNIVEIILVLVLIAAVVLVHILVIRLIIRRIRRKRAAKAEK